MCSINGMAVDALAQAARIHPQLIASARDELVDQASQCDDRAFRDLPADRRHAVDPGPQEQRACRRYAARRFALCRLPDGVSRTDGLLDRAGTARLATALDALAGPDPATVPDELRRTPEQRMADALVESARRALARYGELPPVAEPQPRATVFVTPETLAEEPDAPAARRDWLGTICGATTRRIACDADVVCRQVARDGRRVWVGVRRYPSPAQRVAVIERDRTCRFTGSGGVRCERPWRWSSVHRPRQPPSAAHPEGGDGGPTLITHLALLGVAHYRAVHEGGWLVTGSGDATLTFHPPLSWPRHRLRPRPFVPHPRPRPRADQPGWPWRRRPRPTTTCPDRMTAEPLG